ncbi:MAG: SUMF1/EgtB/PvdO family nonheme iron enzyme, partial [Prevotella sp.]|nr:SUMF1/EgtB/PvdO family nonheme iron enzyme [Prevotella sp.]
QHSLVEPSQDEQVITVLPEQEAHTRIVSQSMEPALPSVQAEQESQAKITTQKVETGQPSAQTEQVSQTKDVTQKEEPEQSSVQSSSNTKQRQEKSEQQSSSKVSVRQENGNLIFKVNGVEFKMIYVEGGTFMMGATEEQRKYAHKNEKPKHKVTLGSYYIGETEVTQSLWSAVMRSNTANWKGSNLPVDRMTYYDAIYFISQLNRITGKQFQFRLPTEAEWEYAARGGKQSRGYIYSGSDNNDEVAWYDDNNNGFKTHVVKGKMPNELGLYDMSGNVTEWCHDWYEKYSREEQINPRGPRSGTTKVFRGGGWLFDDVRVSNRGAVSPDQDAFGGFRLVLDL